MRASTALIAGLVLLGTPVHAAQGDRVGQVPGERHHDARPGLAVDRARRRRWLRKRGKLVNIAGRGAALGLGLDLDENPDPVRVQLGIGGRLYCFAFGGDAVAFKGGKRYVARRAGAPGACP